MNDSLCKRLARTLAACEQRLLRLLAHWTVTSPWIVLVLCIGLAGLASFATVRDLEFVSGRNDLISSKKRYVQLDDEYAKEFMGIDQVVVVVEPRDVQQGKDFVTGLAEALARETEQVQEVFYRIDTSSSRGKNCSISRPKISGYCAKISASIMTSCVI